MRSVVVRRVRRVIVTRVASIGKFLFNGTVMVVECRNGLAWHYGQMDL